MVVSDTVFFSTVCIFVSALWIAFGVFAVTIAYRAHQNYVVARLLSECCRVAVEAASVLLELQVPLHSRRR